MPTVLQFRRGTTSQNNSFTGILGEISIDTDLDTIRVHDGSTAGGFALAQGSKVTGGATLATNVTVADESSDTTCFPLFATAATGDLGPKSGTNLTFNSSSGLLTATGITADLTGTFGVDLGSDAEGDTYYRNSSGNFVRLARGTDNHVMTMNGNVPNWEAASGGGGGATSLDDLTEGIYSETTIGISDPLTLANLTAGADRKNIGIGFDSLSNLSTSYYQIAIGSGCLRAKTTGSSGYYNVAIGKSCMYSSTSVYGRTVAIGSLCGYGGTGAHTNVWIGHSVGRYSSSGSYNVAAGYDAGKSISSGGKNLCLGRKSGGSTSPSGTISTSSNNICLGDNSIANLYCAQTTIASSDERDKTDIEDFTPGLSFVKKMRPITYRWDKRSWYMDDEENDNILDMVPDGTMKSPMQHVGFLAQEVLVIEKEFGFGEDKTNMLFVNLNEDDTAYGMKYERLIPVLVNAIKELSTEIDILKAQN